MEEALPLLGLDELTPQAKKILREIDTDKNGEVRGAAYHRSEKFKFFRNPWCRSLNALTSGRKIKFSS